MIKEANLTLQVKEMDKSVAFYQALGLTLKNRWGNHYAQLIAPGIVIGLHPSEESKAVSGSGNLSIGFTTDSLKAALSLLKSMDINVETREEAGGNFIHFTDPDGTALYFIKPKW
jgi:catechol 2,3-dioxygenase-like lactoylglutathione lyase family enzyme